MKPLSSQLKTRFTARLKELSIADNHHVYYLKWLRYYMDFCTRHAAPPSSGKNLAPFLEELTNRGEGAFFIRQANSAISTYYEMTRSKAPDGEKSPIAPPPLAGKKSVEEQRPESRRRGPKKGQPRPRKPKGGSVKKRGAKKDEPLD